MNTFMIEIVWKDGREEKVFISNCCKSSAKLYNAINRTRETVGKIILKSFGEEDLKVEYGDVDNIKILKVTKIS